MTHVLGWLFVVVLLGMPAAATYRLGYAYGRARGAQRADDDRRELQAEILALWDRVLTLEERASAPPAGPTLGQRAAAAAARLGLEDERRDRSREPRGCWP